jgi:predicted exporter
MRNRSWLRILIGLAAVAFIVGGLARISFNVDILRLLPTHLPQVEGLSLFLEHFAQPQELIVTLETPDPEITQKAADSLAEVFASHPDLVKRAVARAPWEKNPIEFSELLAFQLLNEPPSDFARLLEGLRPNQAKATLQGTVDELAESLDPKTIAMRSYDPYGFTSSLSRFAAMAGSDEFASSDGTFRVIYVESAKPFRTYVDDIEWVTEIKRIAAEWNATHHVALGFTGQAGFVADISGNMQREMTIAGITTMLLIAAIFWLCYRRLRPLLLLQGMLILVFLLSLATAGWFLDQLTVLGVGFASVMIGLSVDYGYFVFQQSLHHQGDIRTLRRKCFANIAWTCSTTAAAFFALNFSSLPGLSQLGNLVGIGVLIGAGVMLLVFAPLALRHQSRHPILPPLPMERLLGSRAFITGGTIFTALLVACLLGTLIVKGLPKADFSANTLRPRVSDAYTAMDRLYARLTDDRNLLSLIVAGSDADQVRDRLVSAETQLQKAVDRGDATSFQTALPLWPDSKAQPLNLALAAPLVHELPRLKQSSLDAGFTEPAFALDDAVIRQWDEWARRGISWPSNSSSEWLLRRLVRHEGKVQLAAGVVQPAPGREDAMLDAVQGDGIYLVSWNLLGRELKRVVPPEMLHVMAALFAGVSIILFLGLRSIRAVAIFMATTTLVLTCLLGAMSLLNLPLSFFNLAAMLLLLGTGTDYSILLLLSLRRNHGDVDRAQRKMGVVILLCCASAVAGFGSISWANNIGLAEMGKTCALGLAIDALISLFLLPLAWRFTARKSPIEDTKKAPA